MFHKVFLLCVVGVVAALPQFYQRPIDRPVYIPVYQEYGSSDEEGEPYQFHYSVNDAQVGAFYQHYANSDGDNVEGSYVVNLPDGRTQKVTYTADPEDGYMAQVTYEGEAHHPQVYSPPVTYHTGQPPYGYH